jgi:hypothetical protein
MNVTDWSEVAVAVGTGLLAMATFILSVFTGWMAYEARKERGQSERHHQENLRPFCVIDIEGASETAPFGGLGYNQGWNTRTGARAEIIKGTMRNNGLGPAKDVMIYLNSGSSFDGPAYWLTHPIIVTGIVSAGDSQGFSITLDETDVATAIRGSVRQRTLDVQQAVRDVTEVVLQYSDVFGNVFRTVHPRGYPQNLPFEVAIAGGDAAKNAIMSTRPKRPTPVFMSGKQPWLTLDDAPLPPKGDEG